MSAEQVLMLGGLVTGGLALAGMAVAGVALAVQRRKGGGRWTQ
jgi:hypothetical protein